MQEKEYYLKIDNLYNRALLLVSDLFQDKKDKAGMLSGEYIQPEVVVTPQKAFYSEKVSLPIKEAAGKICGEFVMCYPPGIPILAPGEMITKEIAEYIMYAKEKGCSMQGTEDPKVNNINVLKE